MAESKTVFTRFKEICGVKIAAETRKQGRVVKDAWVGGSSIN